MGSGEFVADSARTGGTESGCTGVATPSIAGAMCCIGVARAALALRAIEKRIATRPAPDSAEPEASTYYFGSEALQTIPQGENVPLNQVLLQMPAVAQDSFGQIHVRGEQQFRINGVELPEGLSVFGQASQG
jgi:hypothetical protein